MKTKILIVSFITIIVSSSLFSQNVQDTLQYQIETRDGNQYFGRIVSRDSSVVVLKTNIGTVSIPVKDITLDRIIQQGRIKNGVLWFDNPQETRYFFAPNGYPLNPGEAYYQNIWLFYNQFVVGVTKNFSVGAGIVPLFMMNGISTPVWITPKFSIPLAKEKVNLAIGAMAGLVLGEDDASFGIIYSNSTFGSRDKNFSFGIGYMFAGGEFADTPMFNFAAMIRATNRGYFLTENYFMVSDGEFGMVSIIGGRWIIKKAALDYGLVIPIIPGSEAFVAIPWLGITIPFGKVQ